MRIGWQGRAGLGRLGALWVAFCVGTATADEGDGPAGVPAAARAKVDEAEALEAESRLRLGEQNVAAAEGAALRAVELKLAALGPQHPRLASAYLAAADATLARVSGPEGDRLARAVRVPRQHEGTVVGLFRRALDRLEARQPRERAALLVLIARVQQSFGNVVPAVHGVVESLGLLGEATDPEAAQIRRAGLDTLFLDPWRGVRHRFAIAFAGLTQAVWDLESHARLHLAAVESLDGPRSAAAREALQWLFLVMLGRPERKDQLWETAERAGAVSRALPEGGSYAQHIPQAFLQALVAADDGDLSRAARRGQPQGANLEQDHIAGPARKFVEEISAELPALEAALKKHGPVSPEAIVALERHVEVLTLQRPTPEWGQLPRSYVLRRAREAATLRERVHGDHSAEAADGLVFLATIEYVCGLQVEALASAERGIALRARVPKKSRAAQADGHAVAGYVACALGRLELAAERFTAARELRCPRGIPEDPEGFRVCVNLAAVAAAQGLHQRAQEVLDLALPALFNVPAVRALFVNQDRWRFEGAESLLLELGRYADLEAVHGLLKPPTSQWDRNASAAIARHRGDYREAVRLERAFVAAVEQQTAQQSQSHYPDWALRRMVHARGLLEFGAEDEALAELAEALESFDTGERSGFWPPLHDDRAGLLLGFEALSESLGRRGLDDQAEAVAERAYALHRTFADALTQRVPPALVDRLERLFVKPVLDRRGTSLPPLESAAPEIYAATLLERGDPVGAAEVLRGAIAVLEKRLHAGHPRLGRAHQALARLELRRRELPAAQEHARYALTALESGLGPDHPEVAAVLLTLGDIALLEGRSAEALGRYRRALDVGRESLIPTHPTLILAHSGLALAALAGGEPSKALEPMRQALDLVARRIETQFAGATTKERVQMQGAIQWALANWMHVATASGIDGYEEVLRLKARAAASMAEEGRLLRSARGEAKVAAERLGAARRRLARLAYEPPKPGWRRIPWRGEISAAAREVTDASRELARALPAAARTGPYVGLRTADVVAQLKSDEVLVDTLLAGGRYAAWVVAASGPPRRIDLGPEAQLTEALQTYRDATRAAPSLTHEPWREAARAVHRRLWEPVEKAFPAGVRAVYWIADGPLAGTPLEALPVEGGFLLDRYRFARLAAAHDLVPAGPAPRRGSGALIVGDVDFEGVPQAGLLGPVVTGERKLLERVPGLRPFARLPGTAPEVRQLEEQLRRARPSEENLALKGIDATEGRVREAAVGRRIVHLATHGFVRESLDTRLWVPADEVFRLGPGLERHARSFDPLLASGLVFAGANSRTREGDDDGMLTALEILSFDLEQAELVFLSACDTARGIEQAGEGVHGLVRAVVLAGAQHVVASHWPVDDELTGELVRRFYEAYTAGTRVAPADALRAAARALRDSTPHSAPRHWAAFSAYGPLR